MKFDLGHFKKIKEDQHSAVLQHPEGHHIVIAKTALSPKMRNQLDALPKHFAKGGESEKDKPLDIEPVGPDDSDAQDRVPSSQAGPVDSLTGSNADAGVLSQANQNQPPAAPQQPLDVEPVNPEMQKAAPPVLGPPNNPQPAAPQGMAPVDTGNFLNKQAENTADTYKQGNAVLNQMQIANQNQQAQMAEFNKNAATNLNTINTGLNKDRDAYLNYKINPNHVWQSKDAGQKALSIIGILLSGIGSGLSGQPNMAMQVLNNEIDRDIDAQKNTGGKLQNLYSMNLERYHNQQAADNATRLQMLNAFGSQLQMYGMKQQGVQAQGNFQAAMNNIELEKAKYKQQLAVFGAQQQATSGAGLPSNFPTELLPKEFSEKLVNVPGPNGTTVKVPAQDKTAADEFRKSEAEMNMLQDRIQNAKNFITEKGWSPGYGPWDSTDSAQARGIHEGIKSSLGALFGFKRLSGEDVKIFEGMASPPGQLNKAAALVQYNELENRIKERRNADYQALLQNYNPGQIKEGPPRIK
jgi:hypothetical protein